MYATSRDRAGEDPRPSLSSAPDGRTFSRRIDCEERRDARAGERPARGGGQRDPEAWPRARGGRD